MSQVRGPDSNCTFVGTDPLWVLKQLESLYEIHPPVTFQNILITKQPVEEYSNRKSIHSENILS